MKALFFIAWQNMKRKKGDVIVFFLLIGLAALLFYTGISVFFGMDKILDTAYDNAHTADFFYMSNVPKEQIEEIICAQEEVAEYETSDCLYFIETGYRKEGEEEKKQTQFVIGCIEEERTIGTLAGYENGDTDYDSILLPYYMKTAEGFAVEDICYLTMGDKEYSFRVAGFVEDPLFATPLNINVYGVYISRDYMQNLIEENEAARAARYVQHKVRLKEGEDSLEFEKKVIPILTQKLPELSQTRNLGLNWKSMKGGVGMMSRISMGIVLVFSLLLICVVLIMIRFSIRNYIEMNLKNVGILQASGYTSRQLTITVLLEMGLITIMAVILGILLGVAGSGFIGQFQGVMLGVQWRQTFHGGAAVFTAVAITGIVAGVSYLCGRIYKKLSVLESLRGGLHTHNFKKNYMGFDRSRLPIPLVLAGKNIMFEKGKNISILCIVALLSFAACVGFGLYENVAIKEDTLLQLLGSEAGDVFLSGNGLEEVGREMEDWEEIEKVLYSDILSVKMESKEEETTVGCDVWEQPELLENEMVISGRLPKYENEIVLTTGIADILKVDVGDTIYVTGMGERMDYLVCGIDQKIQNMGLKSIMTREGAARLNGSSQVAFLYVYTKEDVTYEVISEKILDQFTGVSVGDSKKVIEATLKGAKMAMITICLIFVVITAFVVALVELLLIKSKIISERKNLGLSKALGFTTGQLMVQTMVMNLPTITIGALCGVVLSIFLMEPMVVKCLSFCGIEKCSFTPSPGWMAVTVVGIVLIAAGASFLSASKIRHIEPVKMLTEE